MKLIEFCNRISVNVCGHLSKIIDKKPQSIQALKSIPTTADAIKYEAQTASHDNSTPFVAFRATVVKNAHVVKFDPAENARHFTANTLNGK